MDRPEFDYEFKGDSEVIMKHRDLARLLDYTNHLEEENKKLREALKQVVREYHNKSNLLAWRIVEAYRLLHGIDKEGE